MRQIIILICQKKQTANTKKKKKWNYDGFFRVWREIEYTLYVSTTPEPHSQKCLKRHFSGIDKNIWIPISCLNCKRWMPYFRRFPKKKFTFSMFNHRIKYFIRSVKKFLSRISVSVRMAKSYENQSRFFRILFYSVDLRWRKKWNQSRNKRISYQSNLIKWMLFLYFAFLWFLSERHKKICQLHKFLKEQIKKHWKMWKNVFNVKSNIVVLKVQQQKTVKKLAFSSQFQ